MIANIDNRTTPPATEEVKSNLPWKIKNKIKPINIEDEWFLYVPNSFTPDDDRFNNTFEASTIGVQSLKIDIFNRWGEVVYQSNDSNFIWNGTYNNSIAPDGTYTYSIEFITDSGRNKTQLGHVNLLR